MGTFIYHSLKTLSVLLTAIITVYLGLAFIHPIEIQKSNAQEPKPVPHSIEVLINAWIDNFDNTAGLSAANNVQIVNGQLALTSEALMGVATSTLISPITIGNWGRIYFTATVPLSTNLTVDILDKTNTALMHNVPNGGGLAGIDATQYPQLKLRAVLTSSVINQTPSLDEWRINWIPDYPYLIYLPVAGRSFSSETEPPPPQSDAAIGFTGASNEYHSGKTIYFPSVRKNDDDWNSSFAIQNITAFATTLTLEFFGENGAVVYSINGIPLQPFGSYIASVNNVPLNDGIYALRVSATEQIGGMVSTLHSSGKMAMAYNGDSKGRQKFSIPRVFKNNAGWTSKFCIHNTESSSADVTIDYYGVGGSVSTRPMEISGNGIKCINLNQESLLPTSWIGSAKITSQDTDLIITVDEINLNNPQATGYLGFNLSVAPDIIYIPRVQVKNNWQTSFSVCNVGPSAIEPITVSYHEFNGSYNYSAEIACSPCSTNPPINGITLFPPFPDHLGSVIVSSDQGELIGLVTDKYPLSSGTDIFGYHSLPISSTTLYVPNVGAGLESWKSTISIQNPNPVSNTVSISFYNRTGNKLHEFSENLPPYGMGEYEVSQLPNLTIFYEGSAVISATRPVAALVSKQR